MWDVEDYFAGEEPPQHKKRQLTLIIYDISDTKQRNRLVRLLEGYGHRIQKSAFEAQLDRAAYLRLQKDLEHLLKPEDHVKIYRLSGMSETQTWGEMPNFEEEEVIIL